MHVQGLELLESDGESHSQPLKAVLNNRGIIVFPATQQHRDQKAPGISYEDDYVGNALAAMVQHGKIEIRYHSNFTPEHVVEILKSLRQHPDLAILQNWSATYKGNALTL